MNNLDWNKATPLIVMLLLVIFTFTYVGVTGRLPKFGPRRAPQAAPVQPLPTTPQVTTGTITGSLSFPSEGIPSNLHVCAENQATNLLTCTQTQETGDQYQYGIGYTLPLTPGAYTVFASLPDSSARAYYSEYVTCGLSVDCNNHDPILVELKPGQTLTDIDPQDWYAPAPIPTQTSDSSSSTGSAVPEPQL